MKKLVNYHCYLMYMHTKKLIRWWFWNPLFALHINCLPASSISLLKHNWSSEGFFWHAQLQKLKKKITTFILHTSKTEKWESKRNFSKTKCNNHQILFGLSSLQKINHLFSTEINIPNSLNPNFLVVSITVCSGSVSHHCGLPQSLTTTAL